MPPLCKKYLFCLLLCISSALYGQQVHVLSNEPFLQIKDYTVLPGYNYSFDKIQKESDRLFRKNTALKTSGAEFYWLKTIIYNPYPNKELYRISLSLPLRSSLYFFDAAKGKWTHQIAGPTVPNGERERGVIPLVFDGERQNVLYLKINVKDIQSYGYDIKPLILLNKEISYAGNEKPIWLSWLICMVILLCFSGYNLYIYTHLKDKTYLYSLMVQLGAIFFITAYKHFFTLFLPVSLYQMRLNADGSIYSYTLNSLFLHIGAVLIITGMIQITRSYLQSRILLPVYDRALSFFMYVYAIIGLVPAVITISGLFYLDNYTLLYVNICILFIVLLIFLTSIAAYKKKVRAAKPFLLANTLPIVLVSLVASYYVVNSAPTYSNNTSFVPELAILSQIFTFAVALVARVRTVNEELEKKGLEALKLQTDIANREKLRQLIEQDNEFILGAMKQEKDKNKELQEKLEANQRELVGNSLYIHQKNKLLADLKTQIQDIDHLYPHVKHPALKSIEDSFRDSHYLDGEWNKFKLHFEQVHPGFFEKLRTTHPALTANELRLAAYFHMNLSTKEIAALLNIEPSSVRQAKARLNKKMNNFIQKASAI